MNLRILFDYVQIFSLSGTLQIEWPNYMREFIKSLSFLSFADKMISLDCIFNDFDVRSQSLFIKSFLMNLTPFILSIFAFLYFFLLTKDKKDKKIKIMVTVFVIFTFFQSSVINRLLTILSCKEIEGKEYLSSDLEYECYSEQHKKWILIFCLPFLCFWCFIYPLFCLFSLRKNSKNFDNPVISAKFGFFLVGYQQDKYYW